MNFKMKAIAAAVASIGGGAVGTAYAQVDVIQAAGASAFHSEAENLFVTYCNPTTINRYQSGASSASSHSNDIIRIICVSTSATIGLNATLDFTYDSFGGSWRGFSACGDFGGGSAIPTVASLNQQPVTTVTTTSCTASSTITINGRSLTNHTGCGEAAPSIATNLGFTDVEARLFFASNENQPGILSGSGVTFPSTLGACTEEPLLGVVWAVAASKPLWLAMEADQVAAGILPASCSGNIDESNQVCAPFIAKAHYASILQGAGNGDFHFDYSSMFTANASPNIAGAPFAPTLERRDPGSGTQAASNAFFLNVGCAPGGTYLPTQLTAIGNGNTDGSGMSLHINPSTGLVQSGLKADVYGIGVFSADKCPTAGTTITGTTTGAYGCLKLHGVANSKLAGSGELLYPLGVNAAMGYYDYTSEEQLYVPTTAPAYLTTFVNDLNTLTATFVNSGAFYNLTPLTPEPNPMVPPTTGTYFRLGSATAGSAHTLGSNVCAGLIDTF